MSTIKRTARVSGNPTKKIRKQERASEIERHRYRKNLVTSPRQLHKGSWSVKKRKTTVKKNTSCRRK